MRIGGIRVGGFAGGMALRSNKFATAGLGGLPAPTHYWNLDTLQFLDSVSDWYLKSNDGVAVIDPSGGPDGGPAVDLDLPEELILSPIDRAWDGAQDNLTLSIWAKIDSFSSTGNWLFSWRGNSTNPNDRFFQVSVSSSGTAAIAIWDSDGNLWIANSISTILTGVWYHFLATHDGNDLKIYVDGALESTVATPAFGSYPAPDMPLVLGAGSWATNINQIAHDGMLAKCGVWDVALTDAEVLTLYNGGNGLNYADI